MIFLCKLSILKPDFPSDVVTINNCNHTDWVCHGRENGAHDFFFLYTCLFNDMHITLPFNEFIMGVLMILNVALTQLHPNYWVTLQAFRLICDAFRLMLSPQSFLFYYNSHSTNPVGWLSLTSRPGNIIFKPFTSSYKKFKERYYKMLIEPDGKPYFYDSEGKPKFLFHWTRLPTCYTYWSRSFINLQDKEFFVYSINSPIDFLLRRS